MAARRKATPRTRRRRRGFRRLADRHARSGADDGRAGEDSGDGHDPVHDRPHGLRVSGGHVGAGDRSASGQPPRRASRGGDGDDTERERRRRRPERAPLFAGPRGDGVARGLRQVLPEGDAHLVPDALQRNRDGDDRSDQGRLQVRDGAGPHAGQHDHRREYLLDHPADGAEARSDQRIPVSGRCAHPRPAAAHAPARAARHRLADSPRRPSHRAAAHPALGRRVAELLHPVAPGARGQGIDSGVPRRATTTRRPTR